MEKLIAIIKSIYPVSDIFHVELKRMLKREEVKKKQWLLQPGEVSNKIYFIEKGLIRGFYILHDRETTVWLMKEDNFIISILSFYSQKRSEEYIEVLEDSIVWSLTHSQLQLLHNQFIEFNYIGRVLTERYYALSELRTQKLRMLSAQDRYLELLQEIPDVFNRIPLKHIASLLGLTPETISRIRAKKL